MNPVELYSNWCAYDRLDGKDLEDGEPVDVQWPDGSVTPEVIELKRWTTDGQRCDDRIPQREAYVVILHRGVEARIRLYGSGALVSRRAR